MSFTLILLVATLAAWVIGHRSAGWRDHARRGLAGAMVVAGLAHLAGPDPFVQHLPDWVPAREALVFGSGLAEIALGLAVLTRDGDGQPGGPYPWIRIPFQLLYIAWALWSTRTEGAEDEASTTAADVMRPMSPASAG